MSSTAGTVAVNLTARTAAFNRKMRRAGSTVSRFGTSVLSVGATVLRFGGVIAGVAGIGGLGLMVRSSLQTIDAIGKLSDRIGETTENLSALAHAASIAGSSPEVMNKSLEMMTRRLGEAAQNLGQAKYGLDSMGIGLDEIMAKTPAEQFEMISEAIMQLPTAAERAAVANNMLGRSGKDLLNLMEMVAKDGIAGVREEAEKLGIAFSRVDARRVEMANDAMTRLRAIFTGISQRLAIELAPLIEAVAAKLTNLSTTGGSMGENVVKAFRGIAKAASYVLSVVDALKVAFNALRLIGETIGYAFTQIFRLFALGIEKMQDKLAGTWIGDKLGIKESTNAMSQALKQLNDEYAKSMGETWNKIKKGSTDLWDGVRQQQVDSWFAEIDTKASVIKKQLEEEASRRGAAVFGEPEETTKADIQRKAELAEFRQPFVSVESFKGTEMSDMVRFQKQGIEVANKQLSEQRLINENLRNSEGLGI